MSPALRAVSPGPHVTIQDAGRYERRRFGVSRSGAMDLPAMSLANSLVGNPPHTPALEFAYIGGTWEVAADSCRIAVTGGDFAVSVDGVALATWRTHTLRRGQRFSIRNAPDAVWGYIAVAQGFLVEPQLGSCSTHLRSRLGGINGQVIAIDDEIPLAADRGPSGPERRVEPPHRPTGPLRVVLGPQDDWFTADSVAAFLTSTYRVTHRGDRMGVWLDGPPIAHAAGFNVLSDGVMPGAIQVPGAGQPVVLLMDCQTVGGYPKLATVITVDLPRLTQSRPDSTLSFAAIDVDTAHRLYRAYHLVLAEIGRGVEDIPDPSERPFWLRS